MLTVQGRGLTVILTGPAAPFLSLLLAKFIVRGARPLVLSLSLVALGSLRRLVSLASLTTLLGLPGALVGALLVLPIPPRLVRLLRPVAVRLPVLLYRSLSACLLIRGRSPAATAVARA